MAASTSMLRIGLFTGDRVLRHDAARGWGRRRPDHGSFSHGRPAGAVAGSRHQREIRGAARPLRSWRLGAREAGMAKKAKSKPRTSAAKGTLRRKPAAQ